MNKSLTFTDYVDRCPKCKVDLEGTYLERPWFVALDGGATPGTPDGPPEHWVRGVQRCFACGHQWEVEGM